jgi:PIN domain nuclease of toxin-antitoxin system
VTLLLDTHVFLWWREAEPGLRREARQAITHSDVVYVSLASAWEIAIKTSLGKLRTPGPVEPAIEESGFEALPITFGHCDRVASLPMLHGDPFDRMLVAQAQVEGLTIVTRDPAFRRYGVPVIAA